MVKETGKREGVALSPQMKLVLDLAPLVIFFIFYKWMGLLEATAVLIGVTLFSLAIIYTVERRLAVTPLVTAIVVAIFGGLTLWLKDETFIKMKPTLVNIIFAFILLIGCQRGKGLLRHVLGTAFSLTDEGWVRLSRRFGWFFLSMAVLNELVWRTMPTDWWVSFKVFGLLGLTMAFTMAQMALLQRHQPQP